jgi:uncharacterized FlaG/YvyC family protein
MKTIESFNVELKSGNHLNFFVNRETNLLVVDLVDKEEKGGNEIVRMTLNEEKLLQHCFNN